MISPSNINQVGNTVVWTIRVTNGTTINEDVYVEFKNVPTEFTVISSQVPAGTTIDTSIVNGGTWTIGQMVQNEIKELIVTFELTTNPGVAEVTYNFDAEVFGLDTLISNNLINDEVVFTPLIVTPLGSTNPNVIGTRIDVSTNDTPCTSGVSEWRLNEPDLVNVGELVNWDVETGVGDFVHENPFLSITGTYDLYCIVDGVEYLISQNEEFEIKPLFRSQSRIAGILCDDTNTTVLVYDTIDGVEYKMLDNSEYLGDPLTLGNCCCTGENQAPVQSLILSEVPSGTINLNLGQSITQVINVFRNGVAITGTYNLNATSDTLILDNPVGSLNGGNPETFIIVFIK